MIIANPIYDIVFKYLMDDLDIAKGLLSVILDEEIVSIALKPQETSAEAPSLGLNILRFYFNAEIMTSNGEHKKVLIELQKAKHLLDVMRFRRYLGDNYRKPDEVTMPDGSIMKEGLPLIVVYFLGFKLDHIAVPVLKVQRQYYNAATNELLQMEKEEFVEQLTHNGYFVQIPYLNPSLQSRLEQVLSVFSQTFKTSDERIMDFHGKTDDPLTQKMIEKLSRAIASEEMRNQMDLEDEIEGLYDRNIREKDRLIEQRDELIEQKDVLIEQKDVLIEQKDELLNQKEAAIEQKEAVIEEKDKLIEELLQRLKNLESK